MIKIDKKYNEIFQKSGSYYPIFGMLPDLTENWKIWETIAYADKEQKRIFQACHIFHTAFHCVECINLLNLTKYASMVSFNRFWLNSSWSGFVGQLSGNQGISSNHPWPVSIAVKSWMALLLHLSRGDMFDFNYDLIVYKLNLFD